MKLLKNLSLMIFLFGMTFQLGAQEDSYITTLKEYYDVSGSKGSFSSAIDQMMGMMKMQYPNVEEAYFDELIKEFNQDGSFDELVDMLAPIYKERLTEEDLKGIIAFYKSPVGKKLAEKTPEITSESMMVGQQWGMKIGQQIMMKLEEKNQE